MQAPPPAPPRRNPWLWVPSLYFAEGIPYVVVMIVSVIMYKRLGVSNAEIALYTSWLYLPWVIKPLWSPVVDVLKTKRYWIVVMQLLIGAGLGGVALTIPTGPFLQYTLAFLWLLAFSSATHDIAADGFYMMALSQHDQAWFVGVRSTAYRLAMITGQGLLIILAGYLESTTGLPTVELDVRATSSAEVAVLPPDSLRVSPGEGPLRIRPYPETLDVALSRRDAGEVDAILATARAWNRQQGFYAAEEAAAPGAPPVATSVEEQSWLDQYVVQPLEETLRAWFGPTAGAARQDGQDGNVGVVYFTLTGPVPPGENVVVNFGRASGDNSIRVLEGDRFTFTEANWDKPMMAVVQLDPKLEAPTNARFEARSGDIPLAWSITFYILAGFFLGLCLYHRLALPRPPSDVPQVHEKASDVLRDFIDTFISFFQKRRIGVILAFLLLFRFAEAQLAKMASPFLLDAREVGGLALTTGEVGFVYGTVGILMLTVGGLLGGFLAARNGLKHWFWWMVVAINLPNAVYIFLAFVQPESYWLVNLAVGIEQFGYGFGFTAYLLYTIYVSEGKHKTAHYALCTGFMALGMMIPGMFSGWLQELIGYQHFFVWVVLATLPSFVASALIPLDPHFGKKEEDKHVEETV